MAYVYVCCYNRFDNLAHAPSGEPADKAIQIYRSDAETGRLEHIGHEDSCQNPAFVRFHPKKRLFYTCSESIKESDRLYVYRMGDEGRLEYVKEDFLGGKSACYLTIDRPGNHLLYVNYWDSTLGTLKLSNEGKTDGVCSFVRASPCVVARDRGDHLVNRQSESHAHAIVLDKSGSMAFVPDLGKDMVHQFIYNELEGKLTQAGSFKAAQSQGPHGPRYLEFHPALPYAFLVNELSSKISVFRVNQAMIHDITPESKSPVLELVQEISTLPPEGSPVKNTCGRVCVHESGKFLLCSNRGHDSLAVYRIQSDGHLEFLRCVPTGGRTPRHFKFEPSGRFCYVANQDSNNVCMFDFDFETGDMLKVDDYFVKSPNFIAISGEQPFSQYYKSGGYESDIRDYYPTVRTTSYTPGRSNL